MAGWLASLPSVVNRYDSWHRHPATFVITTLDPFGRPPKTRSYSGCSVAGCVDSSYVARFVYNTPFRPKAPSSKAWQSTQCNFINLVCLQHSSLSHVQPRLGTRVERGVTGCLAHQTPLGQSVHNKCDRWAWRNCTTCPRMLSQIRQPLHPSDMHALLGVTDSP